MGVASARDVAAALRERLPGLPTKKLHKLLYYCQGHHVAHFGEPLFAESIMAYDMGPVVANLWWQEKNDEPADSLSELDRGQLNTVAYVVSRYGGLTGGDLERLSHNEPPWQLANQHRRPGDSVRIPLTDISRFFSTPDPADEDVCWPSADALRAWLVGAAARRAEAPEREESDQDVLERLGALA